MRPAEFSALSPPPIRGNPDVYCRCLIAIALAVLLSPVASAEGEQTLQVHWNKSSETDLATVIVGDFDPSPESNYLVGAVYGYQFSDTLFTAPLQMSANVGVQYFAERGYQDDGYGATAFIKASYDWRLPWTRKSIRLGLGEGLSYVTRIPMSEVRDFAKKDGAESAKLMNYLEWTIDVPLRQFEPMHGLFNGGLEELSVGFIVWHRSSVFGIFSETGGGVNFMGFGIQAQF
jgi:outer membrane protein